MASHRPHQTHRSITAYLCASRQSQKLDCCGCLQARMWLQLDTATQDFWTSAPFSNVVRVVYRSQTQVQFSVMSPLCNANKPSRCLIKCSSSQSIPLSLSPRAILQSFPSFFQMFDPSESPFKGEGEERIGNGPVHFMDRETEYSYYEERRVSAGHCWLYLTTHIRSPLIHSHPITEESW